MKQNMGSTDRMIRLVVATIITILYLTNTISGTIALVAIGLAVIFALTSAVSFCPLYLFFGINSKNN